MTWFIGFELACVMALLLLGLGIWLGYRWGLTDDDDDYGRFGTLPDARPLEVRAKHAAPSTETLYDEMEQLPIGLLVEPDRHRHDEMRTSGAIALMTAETDEFIAKMTRDMSDWRTSSLHHDRKEQQ